jgi:Na+-translocating ferredoxin:NAD+ oxidoreductase RnfD subunit
MHPQLQQFLNLSLLLVVGMNVGYLYLSWEKIIVLLLFSLCLEHLFLYIKHTQVTYFSFSSLSTTMGVVLMMVTSHYFLYMLVIFLALLQKQFLHYKGQHFFNPSNFALIMGLVLFYDDMHLVMGQLSDSRWLMLLVVILAIGILYRVKRWLIPLAFVGFYLLFQYLIIVQSDPVLLMEDVLHRFYSVSFMVFVFFMLTDPKTTPHSTLYQLFFALLLASISSILDYYYGFRIQHLFLVLFFLTPLFIVFRYLHIFKSIVLLFLVLSAIIYIEIQPPYYYAMDVR